MTQNTNSPAIIRGSFKVKSKIYLTPHYIRIVLTGDELNRFAHLTVGAHNKIFIPPANPQQDPIRRTYTHRALDTDKGEMHIDFVAHGDEGPASSWAIHCKEGDPLDVAMKDKANPLFPPADWYLLAGDHTALPVISVILETLPANATGIAIIQVAGPEDILDLKTPAHFKLKWIYKGNNNELTNAVKDIVIPAQCSRFVFLAAEAEAIKNMRTYFTEKGLSREELSAQNYWKAGNAEGS